MKRKSATIPVETLLSLRGRLGSLPKRSPARREEVERIATLFDVSSSTVYRALKALHQPKSLRRADRGRPRGLSEAEMTRYCEIIAALKLRTTNRQGRHICNDLQSSGLRPALIRHFQPELFDAIGRAKPAIAANEPELFATNLQSLPQTRIICNCISL